MAEKVELTCADCGEKFVVTGTSRPRKCPDCRKTADKIAGNLAGVHCRRCVVVKRKVRASHKPRGAAVKDERCPYYKDFVPPDADVSRMSKSCRKECFTNVCLLRGRCRFGVANGK